MGYFFKAEKLDQIIEQLSKTYRIYAPVRHKGMGRFSDRDSIRYAEINQIEDVVFDQKSQFSPKETFYPMKQTLFYFTEEEYKEPKIDTKGIIVFLRSCDIHAVKRLDQVFLENGPYKDLYYERLRSKIKFILMECADDFENCFCVSMGTNQTVDYDVSIRLKDGVFYCDVQKDIEGLFATYGSPTDYTLTFVTQNKIQVKLPNLSDSQLVKHSLWQEYTTRCIGCGACNLVCPTCSCYSMQDLFYEDNPKCGERRRVWSSCQIDGFSDMAGGHSYRRDQGERMRFKVLHKVVNHKKRFGINLCVGCGRCDNACPEYISFSKCVNTLGTLSQEDNK